MRAAPALTVETIRAALGPDTVLVEYFYARDQLIAAVVVGRKFWKCFRSVPGRAWTR